MKMVLGLVSLVLVVATGCQKSDSAAPSGSSAASSATSNGPAATAAALPAAAAGDAPCSAVVAKLMSLDSKAGDAEKTLYGKMCDGMTPQMRACIAAANSAADRDACGKGQKAF
jgi:hypothetical protein